LAERRCAPGATATRLRRKGKEVSEMRRKTVNVVRAAARWIERLLEVRLPMDVVAGLRTR